MPKHQKEFQVDNKNKPPRIAKLTRPVNRSTVARPRLFDVMDAAEHARVIWIQGPPGAGKTLLASSYSESRLVDTLWLQIDAGDTDIATFFHYLGLAGHRQGKPLPALTPEYLLGLAIFSRRFMEVLCESLETPAMLVLDNYEHLPPEAPLHHLMPVLAESLPPGVRLAVTSRDEPPPSLARLRVHGTMLCLDGSDLALTLTEIENLASRTCQPVPDHHTLAMLHAQTQGWMAGVVLMLAQGAKLPAASPSQILFDYFAGEFFADLPEAIGDAFMRTALMPTLTGEQAATLSGETAIVEALADLQRRNYFITERNETPPVFEYHPLFRSFLQARAIKRFDPEEWQTVQRQTAALLGESGLIDDAVRLYADAGAFNEMAHLLVRIAPQWLAQGRHQTLVQYLRQLPEDIRETSPWLAFWMGLGLLPLDSHSARLQFEAAYERFKPLADSTGLYSSWAGIMQALFLAMGDRAPAKRWIAEMEWLRDAYPEFPSPEIELRVYSGYAIMQWIDPLHPLILKASERIKDLVENESALLSQTWAASHVAGMLCWLGHSARAVRLLERLAPFVPGDAPPTMRINYLYVCASVLPIHGAAQKALATTREALDLAQETGILAFNGPLLVQRAVSALVAGEVDVAEETLARFIGSIPPPTPPVIRALHDYLMALSFAQRGSLEHAGELIAQASEAFRSLNAMLCHQICTVFLAWFQALRGLHEDARRSLSNAKSIFGGVVNPVIYACIAMAEAYIAYETKDEGLGDQMLARALAIARSTDSIPWGLLGPARTAPLYLRALTHGLEADCARSLVRRVPVSPPENCGNDWPWPVKIYALDGFRIQLDERLLEESGKSQRKPMELLMWLLSQNSRDAAAEHASDALWPDADGDLAVRSLNTTLHRLRKLLDCPDAISMRDNRIRLERRQIWADLWQFESLLEQASSAARGSDAEGAADLRARALPLYQADFLQHVNTPWAAVRRERLRNEFQQHLCALAQHLDEQGRCEDACGWYLRGLAVDDTAEVFYHGCISLYLRHQRHPEARAVYERCLTVFQALRDSAPPASLQILSRQLAVG
ncbi:BTAD domain-containing putative transcriptional regulator [Methyloterricola oryzae]|uniref:BTAD domain-containing putative transcriptional regulator n=1 Tax=Methyloterricola oryzae TaxID=1495050 RepID=UPI0013010405|nr:BTAD domain-containing putative transcriptional regulator [Methyloterricola oryzae]